MKFKTNIMRSSLNTSIIYYNIPYQPRKSAVWVGVLPLGPQLLYATPPLSTLAKRRLGAQPHF